MDHEKDWLTTVQETFAAEDPSYASAYERQKFALALIGIRKAKGLTQADVAKVMGVPQSRVGQIESRPWTVSLDRISAYARALGASFELIAPEGLELSPTAKQAA